PGLPGVRGPHQHGPDPLSLRHGGAGLLGHRHRAVILERRAGEPSPPAVDLGLPREFTLAAWLLDRGLGAGYAERVALASGHDSHTWARLVDEVDRAGNLLQSLGVQAEQRVAMLMGASPHFVSVFLGAVKMGAVPVPLNVLLRPHEYRYLLQDSRARALVVD